MKIILASNSPRRKELLKEAKIDFIVKPSNVEEKRNENINADDYVLKNSYLKAYDIFRNDKNKIVIGADTIVVFGDIILGKPKNEEEAFLTLKKLSGKKHSVKTGVTILYREKNIGFVETSYVTFKKITEKDIKEYIKTGEPMDKAGSYAIQGIGKKFIDSYDGDYSNIVGLPMKRLLMELEKIKSTI